MASTNKPIRKLAAIMFTDIADFTEISAKDEENAFALIEKQREILKPIVFEFGGEWLKEMGDGLLISFPSSKQAVNCAIKIQHTLKEINELNLRIGIHQGDILEKDGDVFGDDVNVASRIEPFAAIGGIAISHKVQSDISSSPEFKTEFISQPLLKGVRQEVKIYCIVSHNLPKTDISKVTAKTESKGFKWNAFSISGVVLTVIGISLWINFSFVGIGVTIEEEVPSVGILLMENLGNEEDLFWARGITEDLIIKIAGAGLIRVTPMKDIKSVNMDDEFIDIANQLRVKYLLTSSIYKHENGFDMRCQLIEAETGNSKYANKWSEPHENSPVIVGNLASNIIKSLNVGTNQDLAKSSTDNAEAYELYLKAKYAWEKRQNVEAIESVRGLLKKVIEMSPELLAANNLLGETYGGYGTSEFDKAMEIYNSTIKQLSTIGNSSEIARANQNIAYIHHRKGDFDLSLNRYYEALEIYKKRNDKLGMSSVFNDISQVYERKKDIENTIVYLNQSLEIATELQDKLSIGKAITNLGLVYIKKGEYQNALINFNSAHDIIRDLNIKFGEAILLVNIGNTYGRMGDYNNGLKFSKDSYGMGESIGFKYVMIYSAFSIGKMYADQTDYESALKYFDIVKLIQKETTMRDLILENSIYMNFSLKQLGRDFTTEGIVENLENIYYPSFEVFHSLYQLFNKKEYLNTAHEHVLQIADNLKDNKKEKFLSFPIPKQILEEWKNFSK